MIESRSRGSAREVRPLPPSIAVPRVARLLLVMGTIPPLFFDFALLASLPVISAQKVLGLATLPLGLYLARKVVSGLLIQRVLLVWFLLSSGVAIASLADDDLGRVFSIYVALASGAVSAIAVGIVVLDVHGRALLSRVAVWCAVASSLLVLLSDRFGIGERKGGVGALADPGRGVGLRADPNFLALSLAIALPLTGQIPKFPVRLLVRVSILLGLASTVSRMGIILAVPSMILWTRDSSGAARLRDGLKGASHVLRRLAVACVLLVAVALLSVLGAFSSTLERFDDAGLYFDGVRCGTECAPIAQRSSFDRGLLLRASAEEVGASFPMPAGVSVVSLIEARSGLPNVPHNTLMDALLVAGLFGLMAWLIWASTLLDLSRKAISAELRVVVLMVFVSGIFLSILESSEFWLALGIAASARQLRLYTTQSSLERGLEHATNVLRS